MSKTWWDQNLNTKYTLAEFEAWIGTYNIPSNTSIRNHIIRREYESVLDCGCGLCSMYFGFRAEKRNINYTGIDSSQVLVTKAQELQVPVKLASIESIPFSDQSFDVVHSRHVLEHLLYYTEALSEMIRVAKKEVIVVFFLKPREGLDVIELRDELNFNIYSRERLIDFLDRQPRIKAVHWDDMGHDEILKLVL